MSLKTTKFDVQEYLKTPDQQAAYLEAALESDVLRSLLLLSEIWPRLGEFRTSPARRD